MKYVLDASVALKWVLTEPDTAKALRLRAGFRSAVHEFLAPDTFPIEVAHALARAERRQIIPVGQADAYLSVVLATAPQLFPYLPLLRRALAIASTARTGVYDCLYVALAEREGCEFLTADDKLIRNLGPQLPFITPLASMP